MKSPCSQKFAPMFSIVFEKPQNERSPDSVVLPGLSHSYTQSFFLLFTKKQFDIVVNFSDSCNTKGLNKNFSYIR